MVPLMINDSTPSQEGMTPNQELSQNRLVANAMVEENKEYKALFYLSILYLVFDYGRLHDTIGIGFARPLMILIILLAIMIVRSERLFTLKNKQMNLMWLFILLLAVHIPFAVNNFLAFQATKTMLFYMPFIIAVIICINSMERLKKIVCISIIIMAYISGYAITHGGIGLGNYFADENDLSLYVNMWIPFCYFLFFAEKKRAIKILYIVSLILGLIAVVASFSRGGFVGLVAVFFAIWMFSRKKIVSIVMLALFAILIFSFSDQSYREEMVSITDTSESTAIQRIESWKSGWKIFLSHPLGVGGNNFIVRFPEYQTEYFSRGMWGRAAHSLWFTLMPELGIAGVIIYLLLLCYNIKDILLLKNVRSKEYDRDIVYLNHLGRAFIVSLVGFFASATFLSVLYYAHYWYMTGFIVAAVMISRRITANSKVLNGKTLEGKT